jgi:hypothetical protein
MRWLLLGSLVPVLWACGEGVPNPVAEEEVEESEELPVVVEPVPETAPGAVGLRLSPGGRRALATGEEVPLVVVATDASGIERDVTGEAEIVIRNPEAGAMRGSVFVAGSKGSQATTVVARWGGLDSAPLLVSTLTPLVSETFDSGREPWIAGQGFAGWRVEGGALTLDIDGEAGDVLWIALPFAAPVSYTNAERMLFHWRYEGEGQFEVGVGAKLGSALTDAIEPPRRTLGAGEQRHVSMTLNPAFFALSYDARAAMFALTLGARSRGKLVLSDVRVLRQFLLGVNLAWLDGAFGHDFGHDPRHPEWGVAYDPAHVDDLLALAQANGIRLLRLWVFERCEGLFLDERGVVTGIDPTLLDNFDDLVRERLPKYDVKVYFTLLGAAAQGECLTTPYLPAGPARSALFDKALRPFVARYADSPWIWGIDLMNEPEAAVAGPSGNYESGVSWAVMRDFLGAGAAMVRQVAPHLHVSAGSGWHGEANVRDGRFSGLGFTHLDWHAYEDDGALPTYASLQRRAKILLGEAGQEREAWDDTLQAEVLAGMLDDAVAEHYWGVLPWYLDHPDSQNHLALIEPASSYGALTGRPALDVLHDFAASRGDLGP